MVTASLMYIYGADQYRSVSTIILNSSAMVASLLFILIELYRFRMFQSLFSITEKLSKMIFSFTPIFGLCSCSTIYLTIAHVVWPSSYVDNTVALSIITSVWVCYTTLLDIALSSSIGNMDPSAGDRINVDQVTAKVKIERMQAGAIRKSIDVGQLCTLTESERVQLGAVSGGIHVGHTRVVGELNFQVIAALPPVQEVIEVRTSDREGI